MEIKAAKKTVDSISVFTLETEDGTFVIRRSGIYFEDVTTPDGVKSDVVSCS